LPAGFCSARSPEPILLLQAASQLLELLGRVAGHDLTTVEDLALFNRIPFSVDGRKLRRGVSSCFR
jgi:hypothetical protein